jgi:hypothetical protein
MEIEGGNELDSRISSSASTVAVLDMAAKTATPRAKWCESTNRRSASNDLTSLGIVRSLESALFNGQPSSGGVTASTEMLAARRHAGVHTPVIVGKMIIANQTMAYAA